MKNTNKKNVVYHYENSKNSKTKKLQQQYENEFSDEFENYNRPLQLEIQQVRTYTKTNASKKRSKTAK